VPRRGDEDLDAELRAHLELAADDGRRAGRAAADPRAPRLRAGGLSQAMEAVRDARGLPWLEALVSDAVFAARQLRRHRIASAAIVCSVGLAAGATTAAFRLIDAVLLRPLPVAEPHRLFALGWHRRTPQGRTEYRDDFDYPTFRLYAAALAGHGDALLVGMSARLEVRHGGPSRACRDCRHCARPLSVRSLPGGPRQLSRRVAAARWHRSAGDRAPGPSRAPRESGGDAAE
jgi:hypothetical protein